MPAGERLHGRLGADAHHTLGTEQDICNGEREKKKKERKKERKKEKEKKREIGRQREGEERDGGKGWQVVGEKERGIKKRNYETYC